MARSLLLFAAMLCWAGEARATAAPELCRAAARSAERTHGLPQGLLEAIALTESGRSVDGRFGPWPWALNVEGTGSWHPTRAAALLAAEALERAGKRSFDLGCFQINRHWHGSAFGTLDDMLDPGLGADYAARFLRELYTETGNWLSAAGAYHSRRAAHAGPYRARVARHLAMLNGATRGSADRPHGRHGAAPPDAPMPDVRRRPARAGSWLVAWRAQPLIPARPDAPLETARPPGASLAAGLAGRGPGLLRRAAGAPFANRL